MDRCRVLGLGRRPFSLVVSPAPLLPRAERDENERYELISRQVTRRQPHIRFFYGFGIRRFAELARVRVVRYHIVESRFSGSGGLRRKFAIPLSPVRVRDHNIRARRIRAGGGDWLTVFAFLLSEIVRVAVDSPPPLEK